MIHDVSLRSQFSCIWFLSLLASIEHHMPTTARLCLYWLVVPASGLQKGGWQQQMQHLHDSSPLFGGNLSNGHPLASTVLLYAAFALLIFIDVAKKGTWRKFVTFLKKPRILPSTLVFGNTCKFRKRLPNTQFIIQTRRVKKCVSSQPKKPCTILIGSFHLKTKASPPALVGPSVEDSGAVCILKSWSLLGDWGQNTGGGCAFFGGWATETTFLEGMNCRCL